MNIKQKTKRKIMSKTYFQLEYYKNLNQLYYLEQVQKLTSIMKYLENKEYLNQKKKDSVKNNIQNIFIQLKGYQKLGINKNLNRKRRFRSCPSFDKQKILKNFDQKRKKKYQNKAMEQKNNIQRQCLREKIQETQDFLRLYHDLQSLIIEQRNNKQGSKQETIQQCINSIRKMVYRIPERYLIACYYNKRQNKVKEHESEGMEQNQTPKQTQEVSQKKIPKEKYEGYAYEEQNYVFADTKDSSQEEQNFNQSISHTDDINLENLYQEQSKHELQAIINPMTKTKKQSKKPEESQQFMKSQDSEKSLILEQLKMFESQLQSSFSQQRRALSEKLQNNWMTAQVIDELFQIPFIQQQSYKIQTNTSRN